MAVCDLNRYNPFCKMPELSHTKITSRLVLVYFEDPEFYRFWTDDTDVDVEDEAYETYFIDEAKRIERELTIELEKLGRSVQIEHYHCFALEEKAKVIKGQLGAPPRTVVPCESVETRFF